MTSADAHHPESKAQEVLSRALQHKTKTGIEAELGLLTEEEMAELFIAASLLDTAIQPLIDQHWIQTHAERQAEKPDKTESPESFQRFLEKAIQNELAPLAFLSSFLRNPSPADLRRYGSTAHAIVNRIGDKARSMGSGASYRAFTTKAMQGMNRLTRFEADMKSKHTSAFSNSMYRAFDEMDRVLGLHYDLEHGMRVDPKNSERLYEGAGVGVQTSYSTILLALDEVAPPSGSRLIDLGSGYGRVGLVVGLLRPDVEFIGYEYVEHRVTVAQAAADQAGLSNHVRFFAQDLSDPKFRIPEADVYYMYDPFSQETYKYVFEQLKEIGRSRPITVVTKGRANGWLSQAIEGEDWTSDLTLDEGTIGLFRSTSNNPPFPNTFQMK